MCEGERGVLCVYQQSSKVSQNTSVHAMAAKALRASHAYAFLIPPVNIRALETHTLEHKFQ